MLGWMRTCIHSAGSLRCCRKGIEWEEVEDLAAVAGQVDVLYQTRIQKASVVL